MPACMAHVQFGQDVLNCLDADTRSLALAYRREYEIGLQGPDIFFYYKPYKKNEISAYGSTCHAEPASRMFAPMFEKVRAHAALSYLAGLVCHYSLDRCCHPYIYAHSRNLSEHFGMESAYDRHIMTRHGLTKARARFVPALGLDYEAMASLWRGRTADIVRKCVKSQRCATWLLDRKKFVAFCEALAGRRGAISPLSLPDTVPERQTEHIRALDPLYQKALSECPELILRALGYMGTKQMDYPEFNLNHRGEAPDARAGESPDRL